MEGIHLSYEAAVTGIGNYLSAAVEGQINNYQMKMLEHNKIPGLLAAHGNILNGTYRINYEIDGTRRLAAVLAGGLAGQEAKRFMKELLHTLSGLGEYFLSYTQCLLDVDYIYVDNSGRAKLVYLPLSGQFITDEGTVRQFCQKLFAEYFTADGDTFFLKLLRYVNKQDFSLAGLAAWFADEDEGAVAKEAVKNQPVSQVSFGGQGAGLQEPFSAGKNAAPAKESKLAQEGSIPSQENAASSLAKGKFGLFHKEKETVKKEPENNHTADFAIPGMGFAVPNATPEKEEGSPKKQEKNVQKEKPQKEKGGSLFKSLLGGKKEKTAEGKTEAYPAPGISLPGKGLQGRENSAGQKNSPGTLQENSADVWQGTVMMGTSAASGTIMMGVEAAPYLLYQGQKVSLEHFPYTIGKENTDFIIEKNVVSRMHASISCRGDGYFVMDENSKNHTWLNGRQLSPYTETPLGDGDTLRLASEVMTFHI